MATKTRSRKRAGAAKTATASNGLDVWNPRQNALDGMEDVDERIPALDELCNADQSDREKRKSLKDGMDARLQDIAAALHEHELDCYIVSGKKYYIEPGVESVKVVKVNQQG